VTNRNDVTDLLALAHVFVMPSLWEGLPMAMLEAMVAGKPIVASATGGIPEAVIDGREGILVPPGEVSPLAGALRLVLTDPARRTAMAESALARARTEFTVRVMADRYEALYANAWRKRQPRSLSA
jgi:glycosyltransferase involved in cell wall biosynthesis